MFLFIDWLIKGRSMDKNTFESILYKLSIQAIHKLSGNTQDSIAVQEAIEHNAYFRPTFSCVQLWTVDFNKVDGYCDIVFVLSSKFMYKNSSLTLQSGLHNLQWAFGIQNYDYGEDEEGNEIGEEDGIDGWLIKSTIKVNYESINIEAIEQNEFELAIDGMTQL